MLTAGEASLEIAVTCAGWCPGRWLAIVGPVVPAALLIVIGARWFGDEGDTPDPFLLPLVAVLVAVWMWYLVRLARVAASVVESVRAEPGAVTVGARGAGGANGSFTVPVSRVLRVQARQWSWPCALWVLWPHEHGHRPHLRAEPREGGRLIVVVDDFDPRSGWPRMPLRIAAPALRAAEEWVRSDPRAQAAVARLGYELTLHPDAPY